MPGNSIDDRKNSTLEAAGTLQPLPPGLVPGRLVEARGSRWRVIASIEHPDCRELHLRDAAGDGKVLLWPFDRPRPAGARRRVHLVPLSRWMRHADRALARALDPRTPRAAFAGEILPYQLEPAIAVASGVARLVLADEVGLGKTIQAGWILADLLAREPDARALIAVPASVREQWASELESLFALAPARVDAAWLRAAVADRAADISPWAAPGAYLGSIDFLKRPDVARALCDVTWDLVVVDEAHTAAAPTERHAMLARVTARARRVVIITATPYSGDASAFASMVTLGALGGEGEPLMFRRSRDEAGDGRSRRHRFALVRIGAAEARLQRLLGRYTRDVWQHAPADVEAARLAMTVLRKRALSSPSALLRSLLRRQELLRGTPPAPRQLSLFEDPQEPDEELPESALAVAGLADADVETRWLATLVEAAQRAASADAKLRYLLRLLRRADGEAVVIFTEYRDTLRRLAEALPSALQLHGGLSGADRSAVQRRFNETGGILLATDAAADGLNLQRRCRMVVNYELPWNPARLEQRIGRIDRIGQRRRVHAVSLVARDTAEDLVVAALARRLQRVAATLGERDRLAAFLTDARTARAVIGGHADEVETTPVVPLLPRPTKEEFPAADVARQLAVPARLASDAVVPVAALRSRGHLPPGCIVIARAAVANDAETVAERAVLVHVEAALLWAPDGRGDPAATAGRAIDLVERSGGSIEVLRRWCDGVAAIRRAATQSRMTRERAMLDAVSPRRQTQPGLFDRRAVSASLHDADVDDRRARGHEQHLRRLEDSLRLRLECTPLAVLVTWR